MDRKLGIIIYMGLAIGALLGLMFTARDGNSMLGLGVGALAGAGVGWFIAAALMERRSKQ